MIEKQWLLALWWTVAFGDQRTQELARLGPQRAEALFTSFAKEAKVRRRRETEIRDVECDHLLDTRARIEHGHQQRVVATTADRRPFDRREHRLNLGELQGPRQHATECA